MRLPAKKKSGEIQFGLQISRQQFLQFRSIKRMLLHNIIDGLRNYEKTVFLRKVSKVG